MAAEKRKKEISQLDQQLLEKLAARLRTFRKEKGFSNYEKLAYEHNLSRSQIGKYEKGHNMTILSLVTLLRALDVPLREFFSDGFDE
jgi:transcriptional regulator with XRE-family HTH domain